MTVTANIHIGLPAWVQNHAYSVGDRVSNDTAPAKAYHCIQAGTSQNLTGAGPKGTGSSITDGTARWKYLSAIDYTDLQSWGNSIAATRTQAYVGWLWNDSLITGAAYSPILTLNGHGGGSSTNTITLCPAPGESFRDLNASVAYAFNRANGVAIQLATQADQFINFLDIQDTYVIIEGIQVRDPNTNSQSAVFWNEPGASNCVIRRCLFDVYAQSSVGTFVMQADGNNHTFYDNLIVDRSTTSQTPFLIGGSARLANNIFISISGAGGGAVLVNNSATSGGVVVNNCAFFGKTTPLTDSDGNHTTVSYSITDASTFAGAFGDINVGSGNLTSRSASNQFVNTSTDFRLKATSEMINAGTADTTTNPEAQDAFHNVRGFGSAWDIGAQEYVPGSAVTFFTLRAAGAATRANTASAAVSLFVLRAAAQAKQEIFAQTSVPYILSLQAVGVIGANRTMTARASILSLSTAGATQQTYFANTQPADFSVIDFNPVDFATGVRVLALRASASATFGAGAQGRSTILALTSISAAGQAVPTTGRSNVLNLAAQAFGDKPIRGAANILSLTATATMQNALTAYGLAYLGQEPDFDPNDFNPSEFFTQRGLIARVSAGQESLAQGRATILSIFGGTNDNYTFGRSTILRLTASGSVGQENLAIGQAYVLGLDGPGQGYTSWLASALTSVFHLSASGVSYLGNPAQAIGIIPGYAASGALGQEGLVTARASIDFTARAIAMQEQPASAATLLTIVTAVGAATSNDMAHGTATLVNLRAAAAVSQFDLASAVVTILGLTSHATASSYTNASALAAVFGLSAFGQALQENFAYTQPADFSGIDFDPANFSTGVRVLNLRAAASLTSSVSVSAGVNVLSLTATAQAAQGNGVLGRVTLFALAATGTADTPIAGAAVVNILDLTTVASVQQEVLTTGLAYLTTMQTFSRGGQEHVVFAIADVLTLNAAAQAHASTNVQSLVTILSLSATVRVAQGWAADGRANILDLAVNATAALAYHASANVNILDLRANAQAGVENAAHAAVNFDITAAAEAFNGAAVWSRTSLFNLSCQGVAVLETSASATATVLTLRAHGSAQPFIVASARATIFGVHTRGRIYTKPQTVFPDLVVHLDQDDRVVYTTI